MNGSRRVPGRCCPGQTSEACVSIDDTGNIHDVRVSNKACVHWIVELAVQSAPALKGKRQRRGNVGREGGADSKSTPKKNKSLLKKGKRDSPAVKKHDGELLGDVGDGCDELQLLPLHRQVLPVTSLTVPAPGWRDRTRWSTKPEALPSTQPGCGRVHLLGAQLSRNVLAPPKPAQRNTPTYARQRTVHSSCRRSRLPR